jgi:hypothetical protein
VKTFPVAVVAYYGNASRKRAYCLSLTRYDVDGTTVIQTVRGTAWDEDLTVDGSVFYTTSGGAISDIDSSAALNVDNGELRANFDAITSEALQAGLWNGAAVELFVVDPDGLSESPYGGKERLLVGNIGIVTVDRLSFIAELRGQLQSMQQTYGWFVGANCVHTLGDAKCTKDLTAFTVTGTLDSVSADGLTMVDSARSEAGPAGAVSISSITLGTTTIVIATIDLDDGAVVNIAVVGPTLLNGPQIARNPTGTQFEINVDTSAESAFVSGTVTPLSGESGYWQYGTMELTSGDNANQGIRREIKWSQPGSWGLQQAFPFPVAGTETYRLVSGCDKLEETCIDKFDNVLNFLGFKGVKGQDWMMQVGRNE